MPRVVMDASETLPCVEQEVPSEALEHGAVMSLVPMPNRERSARMPFCQSNPTPIAPKPTSSADASSEIDGSSSEGGAQKALDGSSIAPPRSSLR